ncbi:MAG: N-acetylmuramoyl-L-alanine amidase-like domain-containing protein [Myxococcaceae bacterium]
MTGTWGPFSLLAVSLMATPPWHRLDAPEREVRIAALSKLPFVERLVEASSGFLNVPYLESPLGEGEGVDPDPPLRFDAVDCLTFVEQSIALAVSKDSPQMEAALRRLRYRGEANYLQRNHLMEAQWLPHNVASGFLRDVTQEYGGGFDVEASKTLSGESWRSPSSKALKLPADHQPQGVYPFRYVPLAKAARRLREVPTGTLVVVVREERAFKATRMTHLGIVLQQAGKAYIRHASKSRHKRVVDERADEFVARHARYDKWRVVGVSLFAILEPQEAGL